MKLSIITINYNNLDGLKRTYDSVVAQTCQNFEWIIIDGGSTDGSKEFVEEHQKHFAYWCSEPDKGVYNAMNKGIAKATGEYIQFLNSGDNLIDEMVIEEFMNFDWCEDIISGDIIFDGNKHNRKYHPTEAELDIDYLLNGEFCHQSLYTKRDLFDSVGKYDESLYIVSDWKFTLESFVRHSCTYRYWNRVVVDYHTDGISSMPENFHIRDEERSKILGEYKMIIQALRKRDKKIQELDFPVLVLLKRKALRKLKSFFLI